MPEQDEIEEIKQDDEDTDDLINAIIVVGKTGNGKTSLISIHCGDVDENEIGHGAISKTKGYKIYTEKDENNKVIRTWVDTMGTDDYEGKMDDEDILRQTLNGLNKHYPKGLNIKCIWFVPPASQRRDNSLRKQAKFIGSLSNFEENSQNNCNNRNNDTENKNIWKSTFICIKQSHLAPPENDTLGALVAAAQFGAPIKQIKMIDNNLTKIGDVSSLGYTNLDVLPDNHTSVIVARQLASQPVLPNMIDTRKMLGYLYKDEIKKSTNDELSKLQNIKIIFENYHCNKCTAKGDKRFVPLKCHTKSTKIHPLLNEKIHTQGTIWKHPFPNSFNRYHSSIESYHPRSSGKVKSGTETYRKDTKNYCGNGHVVCGRQKVSSGTFKCKYGDHTIYTGEGIYLCKECTPNNSGYKVNGSGSYYGANWCSRHVKARDIMDTRSTYSTVYLCCEKSTSSNGCSRRCSKCTRHPTTQGCNETYVCCTRSRGSQGCQQYYTCCNTLVSDSKPCRYKCCKQSIYSSSEPCSEICRNCTKKWGVTDGCRSDPDLHEWEKVTN